MCVCLGREGTGGVAWYSASVKSCHPRVAMKARLFSAWVLGALLPFSVLTDALGASKEAEGPEQLSIEGAPPAYYYPPEDRRGMHPVVVYLHGRGGFPEQDCR